MGIPRLLEAVPRMEIRGDLVYIGTCKRSYCVSIGTLRAGHRLVGRVLAEFDGKPPNVTKLPGKKKRKH